MNFFRRKISLRLVIAILIVIMSVVPTVLVSLALVNSAISKNVDSSSIEMQSQVLILANQLQTSEYVDNFNSSQMNAVIDQVADIWKGRIQIVNNAGRIVKDTYNVDRSRYNISEYVLLALGGETTSVFDSQSMMYAIAQPLTSPTQTQQIVPEEELEAGAVPIYQPLITGAILVTVDMTQRVSELSNLRDQSYLLWLSVLLVAILTVTLVVIYLFRPYRELVRQLKKASDGAAERIDVDVFSETAHVSELVNRTLTRAQTLDRTRREFVSNVSHELRTPITSVRVLADSLNNMEGAPVEMYREFMQDISKELERESNIIDDLLSVVRLEEGTVSLNISEVDVNAWLESMLRRISPIARVAEVDISFESVRPVVARFDEPRMGRVITNLVENAVKYNKPGGHVRVRLDADYHSFSIRIEDDGVGIPEDSIPHIFERFYRVDKARSREAGGTGLGLAISRQIVNLHHGTIGVESTYGEGSVFTVTVPLEYRERPDDGAGDVDAVMKEREEELEREAQKLIEEQEAGDEKD